MKTCSKCKEQYSIEEFHKSSKHKGGRSPQCKYCYNEHRKKSYSNPENKKKILQRSSNWYEKNKLNVRKQQVENKYGIDYEKFLLLVEEQNNECAICSKIMSGKREPAIDHDHETGEVRELLCSNCNAAIGLLQDNFKVVEKAAEYLRKHKRKNLKLVK